MGENGKILIINDDEAVSRYLREKLVISAGYYIDIEKSFYSALGVFKQGGVDVVITKFGMSDMSGLKIIKGLKQIDPDAIIIVILDDHIEIDIKEIYKTGIYDVIVKPISIDKLFFLVKKGIELHYLMASHRKTNQSFKEQNISLQKQNTLLAKRIEESTKNLTRLYEDLRNTYMRTIKVLAHAIEARDAYTHSHSENVAKYAVLIAEEMHLPVEQIETIREACELHDLGKIGVADNILSKPSSLTDEEWESIKRHPLIGTQILEPLTFLGGVIDLVKQHHEHYDGKGYPEGLKGEEILLGARIIHLADAYEAMRSARAYRKQPLTKEAAIAEIKKQKGLQFDPKIVDAFMKIVDKLPEPEI
ncbi:MAG: HD domain-containing phosphohydrolase [Candidatus Omnitrophota bacterium]